jgi:type II secretory pathway component PulM
MRPLDARERRVVAIGLLVLAIALVWLAVLGPLVGGFVDRAAEREQLKATLARNRKIMAALPVMRAAAEAQGRAAPRFVIAAPSETLAVEALKDRVRHLATDEGFTLASVEDLQADAPAGAVRVRADMTVGLTQLTDTLKRLENEGAYVVVDYISISADQALALRRLAPMGVRLELTAAYRLTRPKPS